MSDSLQPQLWVVAGPNGAGKSTLVLKSSKLLDKYNIPVINPDNIARSFNPASHTPDWIKKYCPELREKMLRGIGR